MTAKKNYVANWKMNKSFVQEYAFVREHKEKLVQLSDNYHADIVICPSQISLDRVKQELRGTTIGVGAQNCSEYYAGAYTGDISARSLQEIGCNYCIIGHQERRMQYHETSQSIGQKAAVLCENSIIPIICIGEKNPAAFDFICAELAEQIAPVITVLGKHITTAYQKNIFIAYEPYWAIGTGAMVDPETIEAVFKWIIDYCTPLYPAYVLTLLYGGGVTPDSIQVYKDVNLLGGYLMGSSSLELQKIEKILSLVR